MNEQPEKRDLEKARRGYNSYLRYSALGLQMGGIILAGVFGGRWLDKHVHWEFPVFTLGLSLLAIAGAMVFLFAETKPGK